MLDSAFLIILHLMIWMNSPVYIMFIIIGGHRRIRTITKPVMNLRKSK